MSSFNNWKGNQLKNCMRGMPYQIKNVKRKTRYSMSFSMYVFTTVAEIKTYQTTI